MLLALLLLPAATAVVLGPSPAARGRPLKQATRAEVVNRGTRPRLAPRSSPYPGSGPNTGILYAAYPGYEEQGYDLGSSNQDSVAACVILCHENDNCGTVQFTTTNTATGAGICYPKADGTPIALDQRAGSTTFLNGGCAKYASYVTAAESAICENYYVPFPTMQSLVGSGYSVLPQLSTTSIFRIKQSLATSSTVLNCQAGCANSMSNNQPDCVGFEFDSVNANCYFIFGPKQFLQYQAAGDAYDWTYLLGSCSSNVQYMDFPTQAACRDSLPPTYPTTSDSVVGPNFAVFRQLYFNARIDQGHSGSEFSCQFTCNYQIGSADFNPQLTRDFEFDAQASECWCIPEFTASTWGAAGDSGDTTYFYQTCTQNQNIMDERASQGCQDSNSF